MTYFLTKYEILKNVNYYLTFNNFFDYAYTINEFSGSIINVLTKVSLEGRSQDDDTIIFFVL